MSDRKASGEAGQAQHTLESEVPALNTAPPENNKSRPKEVWDFKCLQQATALLNCAANAGKKTGYNEIKCQNLLKALRVCCEAEGVVDFKLSPGASASGSQTPSSD